MGKPLKTTYAISGTKAIAKHIHCVLLHCFLFRRLNALPPLSTFLSFMNVLVILNYFPATLVSITFVAFAADSAYCAPNSLTVIVP